MARIFNMDFIVPPEHMALLGREMKDGDWYIANAYPDRARYSLVSRIPAVAGQEGGYHICEIELNIDGILDLNAEQRNNSQGKRRKEGIGDCVARVPVTMMQEGGALEGLATAISEGDERHAARILNSSDWQKLRTFGGNV